MITTELPADSPDVLVVDDDPHVRQAVGDLLNAAGLAAMFADNGAQALRYAAVWTPRLIVLDMCMPVLDGPGFLQRRRDDDKLAGVPVVVLSSEPLDDSTLDEVQAWVAKPCDGDRLVTLIEHLLEAARRAAAGAESAEASLSGGGRGLW